MFKSLARRSRGGDSDMTRHYRVDTVITQDNFNNIYRRVGFFSDQSAFCHRQFSSLNNPPFMDV